MKRHTLPDMKEGNVNVTPLIDVVMVLIIFFMLVAKIGITRGEDPNIPLPSAILGKNLDSLSDTLTLNVHWNKSGTEPLVDALVGKEKRELAINKGGHDEMNIALVGFQKQFKDRANIIIHADRDMPYSQLEIVLLEIAKAGIGQVSYETKRGSDTGEATAMAQ